MPGAPDHLQFGAEWLGPTVANWAAKGVGGGGGGGGERGY